MSLLDHYWNLGSDDPKERIDAAGALLQGLQDNQSEDDWNYALKRLVKGLASSRGSARLGFSMALAELLELRKSAVTIDQYLELCDQSFEIPGSVKGNEERGILLGRLFALKTLAESSLWNNEASNSKHLIDFTDMLVKLALRKAWLREPPFSALCGLLRKIGQQSKYREGIEHIFKLLEEKGLSLSCECVAVALSVSPDMRAGYGWANPDPLDKSNLATLSRVLREMPVSSGNVSESKPYIHFVWSYLLSEFTKSQDDGEHGNGSNGSSGEPPAKRAKHDKKAHKKSKSKNTRVSLGEFWNSAVDRDFFGSETSLERKMWGFEIFLLWSQEPALRGVASLVSENLIKTLAIHLAQKDRNLNKISKKVATVITKTIPAQHPSETIAIISRFMTYSPNFDKVSKSKVVQQLLSSIPGDEGVEELVKTLLAQIKASSYEDLVQKQWIFDNLVQLVRTMHVRSSSSSSSSSSGSASAGAGADGKNRNLPWIKDIFEALIPLAFYVSNKEKGDVSEDYQDKVSKMAQERIMSIISATMGSTGTSTRSDPQASWPFVVVQLLMSFQKEHPDYEPLVEFDDETSKSKAKAEHTLSKIHKKRISSKHVDSSHLQAFELLFAMVLLQVYGSQPDAITMLDELQVCYYKINGKNRTYEEEETLSETEEEPATVLTEILISLLSQKSVVLRKLSEDVWRTFSDQLSESSLLLLCDILGAQEGIQGQRSLFDIADDSEDEEEVEDEEEIEEDNLDDSEDGDDADGESEDEGKAEKSDSDSDSGASSDYELDEATKKKLAGALGVESDNNDDQMNDDDGAASASDDDSMDDEQMSALDVHLATIFRERRKTQTKAREQRLENSRAKQNVVQLKGRVLDLLEIYYSAQPENIHGIVCIEPLLKFVQTTKEVRLAERARDLLRTHVCRKTNYSLKSEAEIMQCLELLQQVHALAAESKTKLLSLACNQVSVFLSKLVIAFDAELISAVSNIYSQSLQNWFLKSQNQSTPNLFIDFINFLDTKKKSSQAESTRNKQSQ